MNAAAPRVKAEDVLSLLACAACEGALTAGVRGLACACGALYPLRDGRAYFTELPQGYEESGDGPNVPKAAWGPWRRHNFDYFTEAFASVPDSARVLDLGAGPGQFGELTDRFASFVSMDFRAFAPTNAVADITKKLPAKAGSFDAVMASNVLEHIPDTRALLAEVRRVLAPGGLFVATVPFLMRVHQKPYDFNRYTNFQLERLLAEAGFVDAAVMPLSRPVEVYATSARHFYAAELSRATGARRLLLRASRFLDRGRMALLSVAAGSEPSPDYTEGYGLTARRP